VHGAVPEELQIQENPCAHALVCYMKLIDLCCQTAAPSIELPNTFLPSFLPCSMANHIYVGVYNALLQRTGFACAWDLSDWQVSAVPEATWDTELMVPEDRFYDKDRVCEILRSLLFLVPRMSDIGKYHYAFLCLPNPPKKYKFAAKDASPSRSRQPDDVYASALETAIKRQGDRVRELKEAKQDFAEDVATLKELKAFKETYQQETQVGPSTTTSGAR